MSTRELIFAGYAFLAVTAVALTVQSRRPGHTQTGPAAYVATLMSPLLGRWLVFAMWLWLGWHLFVR